MFHTSPAPGTDLALPVAILESPWWQHVLELRAEANALLAFQMGDFFEFYQDDARTVAGVLNIAMTQRGCTADGRPIRMCGVPADARFTRHPNSFGFSLIPSSFYFSRLVAAGHALAVAVPVQAVADLRKGQLQRRVIVARVEPVRGTSPMCGRAS